MNDEGSRADRVIEMVTVLVLGLATVGTAWCGYQAAQWNGVQSDATTTSTEQRVEASRLFGVATQKASYDSSTLAQYAQAVQARNTQLVAFYRATLIRAELLPLIDDWEAQIKAGKTPTRLIDDTSYVDSQLGPYRTATSKAVAATAVASHAGDVGQDYVINTILLAVALFFCGITTNFHYRPAQLLLVGIAIATVLLAAVNLAGLPIA